MRILKVIKRFFPVRRQSRHFYGPSQKHQWRGTDHWRWLGKGNWVYRWIRRFDREYSGLDAFFAVTYFWSRFLKDNVNESFGVNSALQIRYIFHFQIRLSFKVFIIFRSLIMLRSRAKSRDLKSKPRLSPKSMALPVAFATRPYQRWNRTITFSTRTKFNFYLTNGWLFRWNIITKKIRWYLDNLFQLFVSLKNRPFARK